MNPNREEAWFALALEKPIEQRAAFLDRVCAGDGALRQRLGALLAALLWMGRFASSAFAQPVKVLLNDTTVGTRHSREEQFGQFPRVLVGRVFLGVEVSQGCLRAGVGLRWRDACDSRMRPGSFRRPV